VSTQTVSAFAVDGHVVVRSLVDPATCASLAEHLVKLARVGLFRKGDSQVADSPAMYAEPAVESLLERLGPTIAGVTGLSLFPTYSYIRLYACGASLARHQDRAACEISVTLNLANVPPAPWPIWIEGFRGTEPVSLEPGDALVYRGIDCTHWREGFTGELAAQAFLHYVDRDGPHHDMKFDGRPGLIAEARRADRDPTWLSPWYATSGDADRDRPN
jgi:hypothetical protein